MLQILKAYGIPMWLVDAIIGKTYCFGPYSNKTVGSLRFGCFRRDGDVMAD